MNWRDLDKGSHQIKRLRPLSIEEYEARYRETASDLELVERVFRGGIANDQLRAALWPYLFGLVKRRGRFVQRLNSFVYVDHEDNLSQWQQLKDLYKSYESQWKSIMPDQELRFSMFRERKSLIERDVIRCDRLHPFYADEPQNLAAITSLLMSYMMYDFDIGYVQGMSDLACPILYMYNGDIVKSFWVFAEVMKLLRRNFEQTQKTIHFQLNCLYELIKTTDPVFAQYLDEHESSNCFFAFRAIMCQFKRELMKDDEENYGKVLFLWDTIWSAKRRSNLLDCESRAQRRDGIQVTRPRANGNGLAYDNGNGHPRLGNNHHPNHQPANGHQLNGKHANGYHNHHSPPARLPSALLNGATVLTLKRLNHRKANGVAGSPPASQLAPTKVQDQSQIDMPRRTLTETEIFVLSLCLSMIRRQRNTIVSKKLDGPGIHLHFIDPKLSSDLDGFIEEATNIYSYLKMDFDVTKLALPKEKLLSTTTTTTTTTMPIIANSNPTNNRDAISDSPSSFEGYDLLSDFLVINGASGC